jgi:type VI secretion system protein ImpK
MALIDCFLPPLAFAAMLGSEPNLSDTPYETARADMDRLLDQALEKARMEKPDYAEQAHFAVCAFADETVLDSPWPGRSAWMHRKLQQIRFHTANAGVEFFERMEMLRAEAEGDRIDGGAGDDRTLIRDEGLREVLEVYAACLTLGFTGRYNEDRTRVAQLADATLAQLAELPAGSPEDKVFPEAYVATLPAPEASRFTPLLKVLIFFGAPLLLAAGVYAGYGMILSAFVRRWLEALAV